MYTVTIMKPHFTLEDESYHESGGGEPDRKSGGLSQPCERQGKELLAGLSSEAGKRGTKVFKAFL